MSEPAKPPDPRVVDDAHRLAQAGASREMILLFLRENGFNKIDSIKTIRTLYGLTMQDAKEVVDNSDAWSDRFYADQKLHETAMQALQDMVAENPDEIQIKFTEPDETES